MVLELQMLLSESCVSVVLCPASGVASSTTATSAALIPTSMSAVGAMAG